MKRVFAVLIFLLCSIFALADAPFEWDPNPPGDNVVGYNFYRSNVSGSGYVAIQTGITGTTYTDTGADLGVGTQYYYVVTAVNAGGLESGFSNEASNYDLGTPPSAPGSLRAVPPQVALSTQIETEDPFDTGIRVSAADPVDVKLSYYKAGAFIGDEVVSLGANHTRAFNLKADRGISTDLVKAEANSPFAITSLMWRTKPNKDLEFFAFPFERVQ